MVISVRLPATPVGCGLPFDDGSSQHFFASSSGVEKIKI